MVFGANPFVMNYGYASWVNLIPYFLYLLSSLRTPIYFIKKIYSTICESLIWKGARGKCFHWKNGVICVYPRVFGAWVSGIKVLSMELAWQKNAFCAS